MKYLNIEYRMEIRCAIQNGYGLMCFVRVASPSSFFYRGETRGGRNHTQQKHGEFKKVFLNLRKKLPQRISARSDFHLRGSRNKYNNVVLQQNHHHVRRQNKEQGQQATSSVDS
jgi:hypothetical protein